MAGPTQSGPPWPAWLFLISTPPPSTTLHTPPKPLLFLSFSCCSDMAQETETTVAEVVVKEGVKAVPVPEAEELKKAAPAEVVEKKAEEKEPDAEAETEAGSVSGESPSFKEESNRVADLPDLEKRALDELKLLVKEALQNHEFSVDPAKPDPPEEAPKVEGPTKAAEVTAAGMPAEAAVEEEPAKTTEVAAEEPPKSEEAGEAEAVVVEEVAVAAAESVDDDGAKTVEAIEETVVAVTVVAEPPSEVPAVAEAAPEPPKPAAEPEVVEMWGVPLLADERTDVVLLKFLRARDFKVKEAFAMIKSTVRWRREFGIDALLQEDLGHDLDSVVFTSGVDKEGHPVCYNVYGEFQSKELYDKTFGDAEKRQRFLRWRIQFLEKSIRSQLDFSPTGICTFVQVMDLKNSPGMAKRELRQATNQALNVLQDNYPEFAAKQVWNLED